MMTRPLVASRNFVPDLLTLTVLSEELVLLPPSLESSHPIEFPLREEPFVIIMVPDPKPRHGVSLKDTDRTITSCDAYRPNVLVLVDAFETERGLKRILGPEAVGFPIALSKVFIK
jgi:hypothetical protein